MTEIAQALSTATADPTLGSVAYISNLIALDPRALHALVVNAMEQALTKATADPTLAPAASLQRGRIAVARGDRDAATTDWRAAVAAGDGPVVYQAAWQLFEIGKSLAPWSLESGDASAAVVEHAARRLPRAGGVYSRRMREWLNASGPSLEFHASPYAIAAWLDHNRSKPTALPALESFFAVAVDMGFCTANPMPQVNRLSQPRVVPHPPQHGGGTPPERYSPHLA